MTRCGEGWLVESVRDSREGSCATHSRSGVGVGGGGGRSSDPTVESWFFTNDSYSYVKVTNLHYKDVLFLKEDISRHQKGRIISTTEVLEARST